MKDVLKPTITGKVIGSNKLIIQAIDKELSESIANDYSGVSSVDARSFVMSIAQSRGESVFSGWIIQKQHLLNVLPVNTEMWCIAGKIDYSDMMGRGSIQRFSSFGKLLGRMNFKLIYSAASLVLEISGIKGQIKFEKSQAAKLVKPDFREEQHGSI